MFLKRRFYMEVAVKQGVLLTLVTPLLILSSFGGMFVVDMQGQSALHVMVFGILIAVGFIAVFETSYKKANLNKRLHRWLIHAAKFLLFTGITKLILLVIVALGVVSILNSPVFWAILPIYLALYVVDWWDALNAT